MNLDEAEQLLIRASTIDNRNVTDLMIMAWQQVLSDVAYGDAVVGLTEHRRNRAGVYLEPGHILDQVKLAVAKRRELYGIHPKAPAGQVWAVDAPDVRAVES